MTKRYSRGDRVIVRTIEATVVQAVGGGNYIVDINGGREVINDRNMKDADPDIAIPAELEMVSMTGAIMPRAHYVNGVLTDVFGKTIDKTLHAQGPGL